MRTAPPKRNPQTPVTPAQIADILRVSEVGSQWVAGKLTIEQAQEMLQLSWTRFNSQLSYIYQGDGYGAIFDLNEAEEEQQDGAGRSFTLRLIERRSASIPRETFEQRLGLHRKQPGELIDGVRKEILQYMVPPFIEPSAPDEVGFNLRLPMPNDSPFDVDAEFVYRIIPEQPAEAKFETTTSFRSFEITRWYLTPEELEERNHAKRLKYGAMNLRTGVMCPESGWWQVWLDKEAGEDAAFLNSHRYQKSGTAALCFAGRPFPLEFLENGGRGKAHYTWVKPYQPR